MNYLFIGSCFIIVDGSVSALFVNVISQGDLVAFLQLTLSSNCSDCIVLLPENHEIVQINLRYIIIKYLTFVHCYHSI